MATILIDLTKATVEFELMKTEPNKGTGSVGLSI